MKKAVTILVSIFLFFSIIECWATIKSKNDSRNLNSLDVLILQILEIQKKKLTLAYLADPRSKEFLDQLLKDFPQPIRKNFKANITGRYRKVIEENFNAKLNEVCRDINELLLKMPSERGKVVTFIEKTEFPLNLGFSTLVKKMSEKAMFTIGQRGGDEEIQTAKEELSRLQVVLKRLNEDSTKDPYDAVKAMYANVSLRDFPIHWFDDAQHEVGYTTRGETPQAPSPQKRKKWTVLVYLNADNDLEAYGLADINEMEKVGSDDNLNIVVQIDRMRGGKGDTIEDGNWIGTRRYYILRDRTKNIASRLLMNLGERDMGNKKELAEFLTWGIETFPADRYIVVIWNHGMGWQGISTDEQSGKMLSVPDLVWALKQAQPTLAKVNPKNPKFDIVDFDACLMGMIEIAYELRNLANFMIASEETEPGSGMPYQDTLSLIRENPGVHTETVAKHFVSAYIKSYSVGGSATNKRSQGSSVTKSAFDLSKIEPLTKLIDKLAISLLKNHSVYAQSLVDEFGQFAKIRRYSEQSFVDLNDFCIKLSSLKTVPEDTKKICLEIIKTIGYPKLEDRLSRPVVIKRRTPGYVVWGINGWLQPPKELRPINSQVYKSRFIRTPLIGPDPNGDYVCTIGPFSTVFNPVLKRYEFVRELNYKIEYANGKISPEFTEKTGREYQIITQFPDYSPLVAEGHTQGQGNSYGIAVYYPYCLDFRTSYKMLSFAKDTHWDEFISMIPQYKPKSNILLTGGMVEDPITLFSFLEAFKKLNLSVDILWDPKVFGYRFKEILRHYQNGIVITDSISGNSYGNTAPSVEDLIDYLNSGGALLLAAQSVEQRNTNLSFLEEYFKFSYLEDDKELPKLKFANQESESNFIVEFNGENSAQTADDVTMMQVSEPGKPFLVTEDGRVAAIAVKNIASSGKQYSGVYLGFRYEAVSESDVRAALLKAAIEFLLQNKHGIN